LWDDALTIRRPRHHCVALVAAVERRFCRKSWQVHFDVLPVRFNGRSTATSLSPGTASSVTSTRVKNFSITSVCRLVKEKITSMILRVRRRATTLRREDGGDEGAVL
jgi:hypothetical protein